MAYFNGPSIHRTGGDYPYVAGGQYAGRRRMCGVEAVTQDQEKLVWFGLTQLVFASSDREAYRKAFVSSSDSSNQ